jgi:hypothetical protein
MNAQDDSVARAALEMTFGEGYAQDDGFKGM